jgi:hypothetical protein
MQIQRIRPTRLEVSLHPYELTALVAAARWIAEGAKGDMPPEAVDQLKQVLSSCDQAVQVAGNPAV